MTNEQLAAIAGQITNALYDAAAELKLSPEDLAHATSLACCNVNINAFGADGAERLRTVADVAERYLLASGPVIC